MQHCVSDHAGDVLLGQDEGKHVCKGHQSHDSGSGGNGILQAGVHLLGAHLAVDEHRHEQTVDHADDGSLGGGNDAAHDAEQDDAYHDQRPDGFLGRMPDMAPFRRGITLGVVALDRQDVAGSAHAEAQQQAGDDAGHEHLGDGQTGHGSSHDHGNRRGNDGAKAGGSGSDGDREGHVIALIDHHGDLNAAQCDGVGQSRAGDAGKDHGCQNICISQTTGDVADQCVCKVQQLIRDAALIHQVAGKGKAGDAQQGEGVQTLEEILCKVDHLDVGTQHVGHGCEAQTERHWHADGQRAEENDKQNCNHCVSTSFMQQVSRSSPPECGRCPAGS